MSQIEFSHPWMLLLAMLPAAVPLLRRIPWLRRRGQVLLSGYDSLPLQAGGSALRILLLDVMRIGALSCLILIAAGIGSPVSIPVDVDHSEALVILLDVSSSMTAEDFSPGNRLEVARKLLADFVSSRSGNEELGLILLAGSPRLAVPVTREAGALVRVLKEVKPAGWAEDGTAIGSGIASAVNRLRDGPWKVRKILLVTDGVNNRGALAPADAARIAAGLGMRIDTIGIGTDSISRYWAPAAQGPPVEIRARIQIDDKALEEVSHLTGGSYRRVVNAGELGAALKSLAPSRPQMAAARERTSDFFWARLLAAAAVLLICLEFAVARFVCPELPG